MVSLHPPAKIAKMTVEWDSASSSSWKPAVSNDCMASSNDVSTSASLADRSAYGKTTATIEVYANERVPLNTSCSTPLRKIVLVLEARGK